MSRDELLAALLQTILTIIEGLNESLEALVQKATARLENALARPGEAKINRILYPASGAQMRFLNGGLLFSPRIVETLNLSR